MRRNGVGRADRAVRGCEPGRTHVRRTAAIIFGAAILWTGLCSTICVPAAWGAFAPGIVPLGELAPGDSCVARTVFAGSEVEEFDVRILDVVPGHHPGGSLILGLASGPSVERTGIMQGMSGSPVYRDGLLVGAVAMSWSFSLEPIAGITPIEEMLPALDGDAGGASGSRDGGAYATAGFSRATAGELATTPLYRLVRSATQRTLDEDAASSASADLAGAAAPLIPLAVSCRDRTFLEAASELLGPAGLVPVAAAGGGSGREAVPSAEALESVVPGSSIGARLVSGDVDMTAVGTVTWRDGDRILAFGHPLFNAGAVEIPMVTARVHASMPSRAVSFKFASGDEPIGTFTQDRRRVVGGRLGELPRMLPITVSIAEGAGDGERYQFDVVRSPSYAPLFAGLALSEAVTEAVKVSGPATARLRLAVRTAEETVIYENAFVTERLPFRAAGELSAVMDLLLHNEFRRAEIEDVSVELTAEPERRQAFIDRVAPRGTSVGPGDTLRVRVGLADWQGERREREISLVVPRSAEPGIALVRVAGAADFHALEIERLGAGSVPRSYDQVVEAIEDLRPEDTVMAQLLSFRPGLSQRGHEISALPGRAALAMATGAGTGVADRAEMTVLDESRFTHDRPVMGVHEVQIEIVDPTNRSR